ncbi:MAG: PGF-pre-PGF domain-containing protein [Archaeoglobus sp.]|nr:PGF-pre-PGF domain-containing protein [Archaeoglobus sp.]
MTSRYIYEENEEIPLKLADVYTNATDIVNVSIVVDSPLYIDFRFANVIKLPGIEMPENAYRVYEFVFTKFGTRTKVEPKNAIVTFRVANNWIEAEKAGDVRLFEYLNNSWVEHPTELLGVNGSFTYFKSSFNHSGFYYLGYPEVRENKTRGMETNVNETQNISSSSNLPATNTSTTTSTNSINTSSSNSTSQTESEESGGLNLQGALQESLIGNIVDDILNFLSNLIQTIKSFLGI